MPYQSSVRWLEIGVKLYMANLPFAGNLAIVPYLVSKKDDVTAQESLLERF